MEIRIGKQTYRTPNTWNEMTQTQAVLCAKVFMMYLNASAAAKNKEQADDVKREARTMLVPYMLGITPRQWLRIMSKIGIEYSAILLQVTDVVFGDLHNNKEYLSLAAISKNPIELENRLTSLHRKHTLTKNHLHKIKAPFWLPKTYYGPRDRLMNVTIDEFNHADAMFMRHWKNPTGQYLEAMIAVLWRPANPDEEAAYADPREPFSKYKYMQRAKVFKGLPQGFKDYIFLFFKGCRSYIERSHPYVFPRDEASTGASMEAHPGWGKVISEMAGGKFGDLEKTRSTNLWDFLGVLEAELIKADQMKRKHKEHGYA